MANAVQRFFQRLIGIDNETKVVTRLIIKHPLNDPQKNEVVENDWVLFSLDETLYIGVYSGKGDYKNPINYKNPRKFSN